MTTPIILITVCIIAAAGLVIYRAVPAVRAYFTYRGKRLVTCPETRKTAAVDVAAGKAAAEAFAGKIELRLDRCSRWPERHDCGQECLTQIHADPEHCLVWNIVSRWYEGQNCAYCRKRFGPLEHLDHAPALMRADRQTIEWNQLRPEQLPEVLSTCWPVCWNCHIVETFRREHPELVVERKWDPRRLM
jgi:hypothetical protein